jgi:hypothetical protein
VGAFFEPPPPPPEPPQHRQPEWLGPPENVLPAPFDLAVTLLRTETIVAAAHAGLAYPNGFSFRVALLRREAPVGPGGDPFHHWHMGARSAEIPPEALRIGIRLADGRKATIFDGHRWFGTADRPEGPVLMQRGGGGGMHSWDFAFWVWPLPPAGPLELVVEWPSEGVALTGHEIDTAPIRDAATRAETLWPENDEPSPGGTAFSRQIAFAKEPDLDDDSRLP